MADEQTVRLPHGIVGVDLATVERTIPADEPPPLAPNGELLVVGKPTPRLDGRLKVTGAARYTADVSLPGMLHGRLVRSRHAHARVRAVDTSKAEALPGVRAVHVIDRLREGATPRDAAQDPPQGQPNPGARMSLPVVRYVGQPIAAVAATSAAIAEEAARLVVVDYEPLPHVVDLEEARQPNAPLVFPGPVDAKGSGGGGGGPKGAPQTGNVRGPTRAGFMGPPLGDVEQGLKEADVVVDAEYRTQVQTHTALEPHGVVADWRPDGLTVHASTQSTASVKDELAEVFGLPKAKVHVITEFMGGGFGAKFGIGSFGVLAVHLSKRAGLPVKLLLDRREEHTSGGNRPSSVQRLRIGAKKDGTLTAIHLVAYGTAGTGTGMGCAGPAQNLYPCPNLLTEESDVFTNAGPAAAFRAPGHPQGAFALEQAIDELAERLGLDPLVLRDRIDVPRTDPKPGMLASAARREERRLGAERIGWAQRHAPGAEPGPIVRGLGVAQSVWYRITNLASAAEVRLASDGSVELRSGVQDIGGGIRTALAQVVAEELGLRAEDVSVRIGDTHFPPGTASGGSATTGSMTPAARSAAYQVKRRLAAIVAPLLGCQPSELAFAGGKLIPGGDASKAITLAQACRKLPTGELVARGERAGEYGQQGGGGRGVEALGGVQFARVAVDLETGRVAVEKVVAVHDCGRPINPLALQSQINGGVLQGISYALHEDRVLDRRSGRQLNADLDRYRILGARETPEVDVVLLEDYHGRSSTDAAGIGEPSTIPMAAAVANAIYNATGARVRELPMTPARVRAAIQVARRGK